MRALEFIRDHVTFKLPYDFSYKMKNPKMTIVDILYTKNKLYKQSLLLNWSKMAMEYSAG